MQPINVHVPSPRRITACLFVSLTLLALEAAAGEPRITKISPLGLQIGETTQITLEGSDLLPDPRIVMSIPLARQVVVGEPRPDRVQLEIHVDGHASPGIHALRLATGRGISNVLATSVDRLAQRAFAVEAGPLPVALHGNLAGSQILETRVQGTQGQVLVVEATSQRLGSKLRPVVRCYNDQGRQIAWSGPHAQLGGDARLEVTLPADGSYLIKLHDAAYSAAAPGFFRLSIGPLRYANLAFPLGVQRGATTQVTLLDTNLPANTSVEFKDPGLPGVSQSPVPLPGTENTTGGPPQIAISDVPELVEPPEAASPWELAASPVAVNGCLTVAGEEDHYRLPVTPGSKLRFEVFARRAGSPLDGVLAIRDPQGKTLATNDDRPGNSDPGLDFAVPEGTDSLIIGLRDLMQRGGPEYVYRIAVGDANAADFALTVEADRINVPAGAAGVVPLEVTRKGYAGPIRLAVDHLPPGIRISGTELPAGAKRGLLGFAAAEGVSVSGLVRILGHASPQTPLVRAATHPESPLTARQPWLGSEVGLGVDTASPILLAWKSPHPEARDGKVPVSLALTRRDGVTGDVRVRLLTTQIVPTKKVKKDNKEETVEDLDRALRLEGTPTFGPEQSEMEVAILVPADLSAEPWSLAFVAELLSPDGKTVEATAATEVQTLATAEP